MSCFHPCAGVNFQRPTTAGLITIGYGVGPKLYIGWNSGACSFDFIGHKDLTAVKKWGH